MTSARRVPLSCWACWSRRSWPSCLRSAAPCSCRRSSPHRGPRRLVRHPMRANRPHQSDEDVGSRSSRDSDPAIVQQRGRGSAPRQGSVCCPSPPKVVSSEPPGWKRRRRGFVAPPTPETKILPLACSATPVPSAESPTSMLAVPSSLKPESSAPFGLSRVTTIAELGSRRRSARSCRRAGPARPRRGRSRRGRRSCARLRRSWCRASRRRSSARPQCRSWSRYRAAGHHDLAIGLSATAKADPCRCPRS